MDMEVFEHLKTPYISGADPLRQLFAAKSAMPKVSAGKRRASKRSSSVKRKFGTVVCILNTFITLEGRK